MLRPMGSKRTGQFFTVLHHPIDTYDGLIGEVVEPVNADTEYVWGMFDLSDDPNESVHVTRCFLPEQIMILTEEDIVPDDRKYTVVPEIGSAMYRYRGQIHISPMDFRGIPDFYEGCVSPYHGTAFEDTKDGKIARAAYDKLVA